MNAPKEAELKSSNCEMFRVENVRRGHRRSRVSLKQWAILHAVIDHGGFAHAAEYLHLSQSAISYTIGQMQKQLGVPILKVEGRKAQVTPEGLNILRRSRMLVQEAIDLEEYAMKRQQGEETEVKLAIDEYFPMPLAMHAIRTYSALHKMVKVQLLETSMNEIQTFLQERKIDVAINSQVPLGFVGDPILQIEYLAVAHPDHHLFKLGRELTAADIASELEIVVGKPQAADSSRGNGMKPPLRWEVSSFDTAVSALCECLGYGWLPKHRIQRSLDRGKLKALPLLDDRLYTSSLFLIYARPAAMTSEALQLADILRRVASDQNGLVH